MTFLPNKTEFETFLQSVEKQDYDGRVTAYNNLVEIGLPTKQDEYWQYADLAKLSISDYRLSQNKLNNIDLDVIYKYYIDNAYKIIVINGHLRSDLSDTIKLPKQIVINNNTEHSDNWTNNNQFVLMNRAFYNSGYNIEIQSDFVADRPLHILNVFNAKNESLQSHQLNIITVGKNSEISIIEENVYLSEANFFQNTVTQIKLDDNSKVTRTVIQSTSNEVNNINHTFIEQKSNSTYKSQLINIGGAFVRNDIDIQLNGENCDTDINSLNLLSKQDHIENYLFLNHNHSQSNSNQLFKYILNDKSEGVFNGLVQVNSEAQKTNSQQSNKNILLSKNALMNSNPQLEIYADDVKCSHGSATGELEEDAIFYLRSRGIDLETAKSLLIDGFANEIIEKVEIDSVKKRLNSLLQIWLAK